MKVIAKMNDNTVLCEVSASEVANLNGFRSRYDSGCKIASLMQVGTVFNISKMVATSQFVRSIPQDVIDNTKKKLQQAIESLDNANETISEMDTFRIIADLSLVGDTEKNEQN